jgi:hypothetical protein
VAVAASRVDGLVAALSIPDITAAGAIVFRHGFLPDETGIFTQQGFELMVRTISEEMASWVLPEATAILDRIGILRNPFFRR